MKKCLKCNCMDKIINMTPVWNILDVKEPNYVCKECASVKCFSIQFSKKVSIK